MSTAWMFELCPDDLGGGFLLGESWAFYNMDWGCIMKIRPMNCTRGNVTCFPYERFFWHDRRHSTHFSRPFGGKVGRAPASTRV